MQYNVYNYSNQLLGQVEARDAVEAWSEAAKRYENILDVREWINRFVMFHTSPISNAQGILEYGLVPKLVPHQESPWAPRDPVIYMANSKERVKDYAKQAYEMGKDVEIEWVIFKIEYAEFPEEIHQDLLWGLPGVYYTYMSIPPEHISLVEHYSILSEE